MSRRDVLVLVLAFVAYANPAAADEPACIVHGSKVTLEQVRVRPTGEPPFTLTLRQAPVTAQLPARCGDPLALSVKGPLEFTATRADVWLRLAREVSSKDGMVTLAKGAQLIDACIDGDRVRASAVLYGADVLEGEQKRPDQRVRDVEVPCDALTLDPITDEDADALSAAENEADAETEPRYWQVRPRATRLVLRRAPKVNARAYVIEASSCEGCIDVVEVRRRGAWVQVEASNEGVTIRGWARVADLARVPEGTGIGHSYGCYGDHGGGMWGEVPPAGSVVRDGTVRRDTIVYASEASGPWGRFSQATRVQVRITPGQSWAELRVVPGLDGYPSAAPIQGVIPVDTLTLDPAPAVTPP